MRESDSRPIGGVTTPRLAVAVKAKNAARE